MSKYSDNINRLMKFFSKLGLFVNWVIKSFPKKNEFGSCRKSVCLEHPCYIDCPSQVYIDENVRIRYGLNIINAATEKVSIGKYSVLAPNCIIATNSHCPTVGIPQCILGASHINDRSADVIIDEDVWIGASAIILAGVHIGRGSVIAGGAIVTHDVPPYTLAVGCPARVIKRVFSKDQILEHERQLYSENERMSISQIDDLFNEKFNSDSVLGLTTTLTEDQTALIDSLKAKFNYVEPQ